MIEQSKLFGLAMITLWKMIRKFCGNTAPKKHAKHPEDKIWVKPQGNIWQGRHTLVLHAILYYFLLLLLF